MSNQGLPLVSICIPAYNAAPFIAETLESALAQDYAPLEVIVSDDASTDATLKIVQTYEGRGVRVLTQERNLGMHANWNAVIRASRGKYVCKLDADDLLAPSYVSSMVPVLEAHPRVAFAHCACRLIDLEGHVLGLERSVHGSFIRPGLQEWRRYVLGPRAVNIVMLRRAAFDAVGGYDERFAYSGDWKMHRDLLRFGDVFYHDHLLASYRLHALGKKGLTLLAAKEGLMHFGDMEQHWPSGLPGKERLLLKARRQWATMLVYGLAQSEAAEAEAILEYLPLYGSFLWPRVLARLVRGGGADILCRYLHYKRRLRQGVKRLFYQSRPGCVSQRPGATAPED